MVRTGGQESFYVTISDRGRMTGNTSLGHFCTAEEAARAYDKAMRKAGRRVVNFPRRGTNEVQAVKGEKEETTLLCAAGERLPPRHGPLPANPGYKGVLVDARARTASVFLASISYGHVSTMLGSFCTAEAAARAYDDAVRKLGRRVVNFPRPGTNEVQAVKGEKEEVTLQRAGELPPPRSGPLPPDPGYKGVHVDAKARTAAVFEAGIRLGGTRTYLGHFCTAEEAARAYDDAARKAGRRVVNFLRPGTNEVQAVKGEEDKITLKRHSEQSAGGAGAAGGITSHGKATPLTKRHAAAPPPSQLSRKRAAASAETLAPAAVKPESPAAPPPEPYTRRPPHRIDTAAWPPRAGGEHGVDALAAGIKMEAPPTAAVKSESPAAPPPARYTRRPPHRIAPAASPPRDGPLGVASGVKTESFADMPLLKAE